MDTNRETLYAIAARVREGVLVRPNGRWPAELKVPDPTAAPAYSSVSVTPNRVKRTVLTNVLPGGMTTRPQIESLETALDAHRCEGWISELILEAGRRAGRKLDELSLSALGQVEPRHGVVVSGYVEKGCDAQTWGVALQLDHHTRGLQIIGWPKRARRCTRPRCARSS